MNDNYKLVEPLPEFTIVVDDERLLHYEGGPSPGWLRSDIEEWCTESLQASWKFTYKGFCCYRVVRWESYRTGIRGEEIDPKPIYVTTPVIEFSTIADKILFVLRWCGDD